MDRKRIKKIAFEDPKGSLIKAFLIIIFAFTLVLFLISILLNKINYSFENELLNNLFIDLALIIISPLALGFMNMFLLNSKDELYSVGEVFKNFRWKYISLFGVLIIIYTLVSYLLLLLPYAGYILNLILTIIMLPIFLYLPLVYLENKDLKRKQIIEEVFKLLEGNYIKFYGTLLSFTILFVLGLFTLGLFYIWLIPYVIITLTYLYLNLKEKEYTIEKGFTNGKVIIVFLISLILFMVIYFVNIEGSLDSFISTITNSTKLGSGDTTLTYASSEITFDAPSYDLAYETNTSKTYIDEDSGNMVQYSVYYGDYSDIMDMDKEIADNYKEEYEVKEEEFTLKVGKEVDCYSYSLYEDELVSKTLIAYYTKNNLVVTISLTTADDVDNDDLKEFITVY